MKTNNVLKTNIIISYVALTMIALLLLFIIVTTASAQLLLDELEDRLKHADDCPANPINGGTGPCICGASNSNNDLSPIQPAPDIEGDSQYIPPDQYIGPDVEPPDIQYVDPDQNYDNLLPGDIVVITPGDQDSTTPYPDPDSEYEVFPPSNNDFPDGTDYTDDDYSYPAPPTISTDRIPDAALPTAAGASAIILALGALGAASANGIPPHEAIGELKDLLRGGRSSEDILSNPRLHDKITDADGKQWVYYRRPGDEAGDGWTTEDQYKQTLTQEKEGKNFNNRWGWTSKEETQSYEANLERQRELERKDALSRQEEMHQAAEKRAEKEKLRREAEAKVLEERKAAAIRKRDEGITEAEYWNRQASFYDYAAKSAELVKAGADKSIDMLADVTGPKGKTIRTAYRAASALAEGVGEGMASGNWTDSMTDAAGTMAADLIEDKISSERYKKAYGVFREGAAGAWQEGRQAWRAGEDVSGTAAQAFLEGAGGKASEDFKEALGARGAYFYEAGEGAVKSSYNAFKDGATVIDALLEGGTEALGSAGDSLVDYTLNQGFDRVLPDNLPSASGLVNDFYGKFKDEATGKVIEGTQSFLKGDGFSVEI